MDAAISPAESALSSVSDESQNTKDPDYREDQHHQAPSTATNSDELMHHNSTRSSSKNLSPASNGPDKSQPHAEVRICFFLLADLFWSSYQVHDTDTVFPSFLKTPQHNVTRPQPAPQTSRSLLSLPQHLKTDHLPLPPTSEPTLPTSRSFKSFSSPQSSSSFGKA